MKYSSGLVRGSKSRLDLTTAVVASIVFLLMSATRLSIAQDNQTNQNKTAPNAGTNSFTPSQLRGQAYAKLLEGQRYFSTIADGDAENKLKAAEVAFKEAIALNAELVEAHTALAETSFYLEKFDEAITECQTAIKLSPDNFGAHRVLSRIYALKSGLREGNLNQKTADFAVTELKEVVRLDRDNAEGWALLGDFYNATNKVDETIDAYKHWAAAPPSSDARFFQVFTDGRELTPDAAWARLAQSYIAARRPEDAVAAARQALAANPEKHEYGTLLGQAIDLDGGSSPKVVAELRGLVQQNPENAALIITLARAQARAGMIDDSANTLKTAIAKLGPTDLNAQTLHVELAQIYGDAGRFDDSIATYNGLLTARKISDTDVASDTNKRFAAEVLRRIVDLQLNSDNSAGALETVARIRRIMGPTDTFADKQLITILNQQGKRQEALDVAKNGATKFAKDPDFLRLQGDALTSLGRVDDAVALMKERLKGNLTDFSVLLTISSYYMDGGRGPESVDYAKKAIALVPRVRTDLVAIGMTALASAQERSGDLTGAESTLRLVLKDDPRNATALNNLGYFLAERSEHLDEAVGLIQNALKQEPGNPSFMDSLGWAYYKQGNLSDAEKYLTDAARRSHTSAAIQEHLGDLYVKQQQHDKAIAAFKRAKMLAVDKEVVTRIDGKLSALSARQ